MQTANWMTMDTRRCEACTRQVPSSAQLCADCAEELGRCPTCGADYVYDPAACPQCYPRDAADFPEGGHRDSPRACPKPLPKPFPRLTAVLTVLCVAMSCGYWGVSAGGEYALHSLCPFGIVLICQAFDGTRPWGLLELALLHRDLLHLTLNLVVLCRLGGPLERSLGWKRALLISAAAAWVSGGVQLLVGPVGIGFSGVLYAIIGFGWMVRERYPELQGQVTSRLLAVAMGWMVFCIGLTVSGIEYVANGAHAGGLLFGLAAGALHRNSPTLPRAVPALGLATLVCAATLPLYWAPWSAPRRLYEAHGLAVHGDQATLRGDNDTAIRYYRESLAHGGDPRVLWWNLALAYGRTGRTTEYQEALTMLRSHNPIAATQLEVAGAVKP